ncbi:hypothetical protein BKA70DRAFT_1316491 [Coprinopsis sp. MPI-PUGE-AT-0042]|nr:hypothetical protein BKA70DRAFT_1316491 [Coprinopsis sp. MPI-PUGE-AT-0042]
MSQGSGTTKSRSSCRRTTMGLPLEVFCEILVWISDDLEDTLLYEKVMAYQELSLVCRDWNTAVEGEKRLWTSCSIRYELQGFFDTPIPSSETLEEKRKLELEALQRFYLHAGNLPLDLEVTIDSYDEEQHGDLKSLIDFVVSWGQRWNSLILDAQDAFITSTWIPDLLGSACLVMTSTGRSPFAGVQHLALWSISLIEAERSGNQHLPLSALFSGLKTLNIYLHCLDQSRGLPAQLALPALESLKLRIEIYEDIPHLSLHDVLTNTPNLKSLEFVNPRPDVCLFPTTHTRLQVLIIEGLGNALKELRLLTLPALAVLIATVLDSPGQLEHVSREPEIDEVVTGAILGMVEQSQCQLEVLRLNSVIFHRDNILKLHASLKFLRFFVVVKEDRSPTWHDGELERQVHIVVHNQNLCLDPRIREQVLEHIETCLYNREA